MPFLIRLDVKEDLEFLQSIMDRSIEKIKTGGLNQLAGAEEIILRIHDAVHQAVPMKEANQLGVTDEFGETPKKKRRTKAEMEAAGEIDADFCKTHPKYGAARPPRTACEGCWEAYKRFHPLEYGAKRKKFESLQS